MTELKIKNGIMKSVFITFDQAFYERILALLDRQNCRGFSYWQQLQGRGSVKGEPHYGSHAWPSMCSAIMTVVERRFESVFSSLKKKTVDLFLAQSFFFF